MSTRLPVLERIEQRASIPAGDAALDGTLAIPEDATAVVLFAHGSGSGRNSPRNRFVAEALAAAGLATLLTDLLTPDEGRIDARTGQLRFDIRLLADRLTAACDWLHRDERTKTLAIGLFGASTGAAAALRAAHARPRLVRAIVSRGGRPDLAGDALPEVRAPTLLIVGGADDAVVDLNRRALQTLAAPKEIEIVAGATHLFEEPGALQRVADLARDWFLGHLRPAGHAV